MLYPCLWLPQMGETIDSFSKTQNSEGGELGFGCIWESLGAF